MIARSIRYTIVALVLLVAGASATTTPLVTGVGAVGLTVSDMERSVAFYTNVLTFAKVSDVEVAGEAYERLQGVFGARLRVVRLALGDEQIELTEYIAPRGKPRPDVQRSNDRFFQHVAIIVSNMDSAYARLRAADVEHASSGPQRLPDWNTNAGGIQAFYFRDPDGHPLEVLAFPPEKGAAKWHTPTTKVFLGIDHTAIVIDDTEASRRFYSDLLGFAVAGMSENSGTEQEHLNNVFGARLRITGNRVASGPAIEFLEYLAPRDGAPMPSDERANDLVHWQTQLIASDLAAVDARLRAARVPYVSSGIVSMPSTELGFRRGLLVRDPDGHVMEIVER